VQELPQTEAAQLLGGDAGNEPEEP
jgi:hypothetical protein